MAVACRFRVLPVERRARTEWVLHFEDLEPDLSALDAHRYGSTFFEDNSAQFGYFRGYY